MENYFNIPYEFDQKSTIKEIDSLISENQKGYIVVADGTILSLVNKNDEYRRVISESIFAICDSSWVPLYLRWIYGIERKQYCGCQIFRDIIETQKYNMMFLGTNSVVLESLRTELLKLNPNVKDMCFSELPFKNVDDFDYKDIASEINIRKPDIIWVALGAPKQEIFMNRLLPYLDKGVMIAVGAVFNFYSGLSIKRAPKWMINNHLEFLYRLYSEPKKQFKRCFFSARVTPFLLLTEWRKKNIIR